MMPAYATAGSAGLDLRACLEWLGESARAFFANSPA